MIRHDHHRREFVKKAAYVAPAILSLQAFSSVAKAGSGKESSGPVTEPVASPKPGKKRR
jgi:hypothetical protein